MTNLKKLQGSRTRRGRAASGVTQNLSLEHSEGRGTKHSNRPVGYEREKAQPSAGFNAGFEKRVVSGGLKPFHNLLRARQMACRLIRKNQLAVGENVHLAHAAKRGLHGA